MTRLLVFAAAALVLLAPTAAKGRSMNWVLTVSAHDQTGRPVEGACFAIAFHDPITNQNGSVSTCTGSTGSNNVAFGDQITSVTVRQTSIPAGCTGGLTSAQPATSGILAVTLVCGRQNRPPVAQPDTFSVRKGGTLTRDVLANDSDPDVGDRVVSAKLVRITLLGRNLSFEGGTFRYTPKKAFVGTVCMHYSAVDTHGATSQPAAVTIHVGSPPSRVPCEPLVRPNVTAPPTPTGASPRPAGTKLPSPPLKPTAPRGRQLRAVDGTYGGWEIQYSPNKLIQTQVTCIYKKQKQTQVPSRTVTSYGISVWAPYSEYAVEGSFAVQGVVSLWNAGKLVGEPRQLAFTVLPLNTQANEAIIFPKIKWPVIKTKGKASVSYDLNWYVVTENDENLDGYPDYVYLGAATAIGSASYYIFNATGLKQTLDTGYSPYLWC